MNPAAYMSGFERSGKELTGCKCDFISSKRWFFFIFFATFNSDSAFICFLLSLLKQSCLQSYSADMLSDAVSKRTDSHSERWVSGVAALESEECVKEQKRMNSLLRCWAFGGLCFWSFVALLFSLSSAETIGAAARLHLCHTLSAPTTVIRVCTQSDARRHWRVSCWQLSVLLILLFIIYDTFPNWRRVKVTQTAGLQLSYFHYWIIIFLINSCLSVESESIERCLWQVPRAQCGLFKHYFTLPTVQNPKEF